MAETPQVIGETGTLKPRGLLKLYRTAILNGYRLTREQRREIVEFAQATMRSRKATRRAKIAAAKVLLAADKMDLDAAKLATEQVKGETPEQHLHLHGGPAQMFQDVIKAIRERDAIPAPRIEPATAEPAGDDK